MCRTALLMKERRFLWDCEALLCSPNHTDTHGCGCICVSRSFLGGLHSTHWASRGPACFQVLFSSLPKLSTSSSSPPSLIQLCWVKRREQLWKDFISPKANLTFIPSLKWFCGKLALVWNDSGIILPTAVKSSYQIKEREAVKCGSSLWNLFSKANIADGMF